MDCGHSAKRGFGARSLGWALALAAGLLLLPVVHGQTVKRGPYLQMGTATSQIVRWRTDVATDSRVRIGPSPAELNQAIDVPGSTTDHAVPVTGLAPNTVYYYSVGSSALTLAGADSNHYFVTPPAPGTAEPVRIWVLGDAGTAGPTGSSASQTAVKNSYATFNGNRYTDLILMLGDNAYNNGTDTEYQNAVFSMYPSFLRQTNLWPTIGNHDTASSSNPDVNTLPYFRIFSLPTAGEAGGQPSGTEKYYSFDFGNIHFVCLDSMTSNRTSGGAMLTWLQADLAANTKPWVIAFWHHPPYSKGSHNSDTETALIEMRTYALPILESYGVDLVLGGHSHSYERSYLIGGHYGFSSTLTAAMIKDGGSGRPEGTGAYNKAAGVDPQRAVYAVAGSSGQTSGGTLNHPVMFVSLNVLGSMVLDIDGSRLDAKFLRSDGTVADSFTIVKAPGNVAPSVAITAPGSGAAFVAPTNISITANASDSDGTIARVDFYAGTTLLGTSTTAPYGIVWNASSAGSYALTARATDNGGAMTTSAAVNVTVSVMAPAAPTSLAATAVSTSRIDLNWTDNAGNETGFLIERSTDGKSFAQVGSVGANTTSWSSTGLAKNRLYYFRVRATSSGTTSAYSNTASARTLRK